MRGANGWRDREGRTEQLAPLVGRLVFDETLVPRANVLASLAPQKTNAEGGDLKRPERDVGFVVFPNMVHVLAPGGLVRGTAKVDGAGGADNT
jgi:hypothetical protein